MSEETGTPDSGNQEKLPEKREPNFESRLMEWAKSFGTLLVGLASLWVSYSVANIQRDVADNQNKNSEQDLSLKHSTFDQQRKADHARLAANVIAFLKCNDDLQRASALGLLSTDAPEYIDTFENALLEKCTALPASARTELGRIREQAQTNQEITEFAIRLGNARDYKTRDHSGPAARLFEEASRMIPAIYASRLKMEELQKAREAFTEGNFKDAADRFAVAFRDVPDVPSKER